MTFRPLTDGESANFQTILRAAEDGNLALLQTYEKASGNEVALVCALNRLNTSYEIIPLAVLIQGDPYELYADPLEDMPEDAGEEVTS